MPDASVPSLAALAHEVRLAWCGPEVEVEGILSAKTGGCPEDCHFCSQSAKFDTPVKATPFLDTDEVLAAAAETAALGAVGVLHRARRPRPRRAHDGAHPRARAAGARRDRPQRGRVSAGILTEDQARRLAEGGVHRYNHNLETAALVLPARSSPPTTGRSGSTPASWCASHGMELCCGVLLGMGESRRPAPRAHRPAPRRRPRRGAAQLPQPPARHAARRRARWSAPLEAIRWIALFRLGLPSVILRYAGGREVTLRELQAMGMTSGINALIVGNYLTTLGRTPDEDLQMLDDLQMPIGVLGKVI